MSRPRVGGILATKAGMVGPRYPYDGTRGAMAGDKGEPGVTSGQRLQDR